MSNRCTGRSPEFGAAGTRADCGVDMHVLLNERMAERERIARELHDTLLQGIQALIMTVQSALARLAPADPAREMLDLALRRADDIIEEGRDRILGLRSAPESHRELSDALVATGIELAQGTSVPFAAFVEGVEKPLSPAAWREAHAIGREALINAFRHANARSVEATFIFSDDHFRLRVRDDGQGFSEGTLRAAAKGGHWGLRGMQERAQSLGAKLVIWSRPGAGTEVELVIPARVAFADASAGTAQVRPGPLAAVAVARYADCRPA